MQKKAVAVIILLSIFILAAGTLFNINFAITSTLIIALCAIPFFMLFENKKPRARDIAPIAVMTAVAVASRLAFAPIPQFKPIVAVVIITAAVFGAESGFLCGAAAILVSNFFFGQGPYTPWQMFCCGIIGFAAGALFQNGFLKKRAALSLFGLVCGFLFGVVVDTFTVIAFMPEFSVVQVLAVYAAGFWFNATLAFATALFLYLAAVPTIEKLERIKTKFGILNR